MPTLRYRSTFWLSCFLFLGTLLTGCAGRSVKTPATTGQVVPLVGTYKVNEFVFKNGLRLLVVQDHSSPTLAYQTWYHVGSRNEIPNYTGLAHLFEHMMFKGTTAHPEGQFEKIMEQAGAEGLNAFTTRDYTAFVEEVPSSKLSLVAELESDRMTHLVVNPQSFKTEVGVVQNERLYRDVNNPEGMIENELYGLAFKQSPYHWPVVGYQADLERMAPENARQFYKNYYNPSHATVVIVGDVTPQQAYSVVQKYYGDIPNQPTPPHEITQEPPQTKPLRKNIQLNIQVQKLVVAYKAPPVLSPDAPKLEVLASVLAGGRSSRLYRALVDTGIASSVDASNPGNIDTSLFTIDVDMQKGKKAAQAEAVIHRVLRQLKLHPISKQEMERAKNQLTFDFYYGLSSNPKKAEFLGYFDAATGSFKKGVEYRKAIAATTPEQLQQVVKQYIQPTDRTVITAVPKH